MLKLGMFTYTSPSHTIKPYSNDDTISNLKFIGKIRDGDKINTANLYIQPRGIVTKFSRTVWNQDNRNNTFAFVVNTVTLSMNILNLNLGKNMNSINTNPVNLVMCNSIIIDIENALIGIQNLGKTYKLDTMFCCKLETFIQEIKAQLEPVKQRLSNEFKKNIEVDLEIKIEK